MRRIAAPLRGSARSRSRVGVITGPVQTPFMEIPAPAQEAVGADSRIQRATASLLTRYARAGWASRRRTARMGLPSRSAWTAASGIPGVTRIELPTFTATRARPAAASAGCSRPSRSTTPR